MTTNWNLRLFFGLALAVAATAAEPMKKIEVHGHRGARAMRPENTLPAFEYAIGIGVDVLELDMAVTKDNVVVVSHDPILRAPVCSPPPSAKARMAVIHQLTLAQVREWDCGNVRNPDFRTQQPVPGTKMPTLDEVFQLAAKSRVKFNIETKITPERTTRAQAEARLVQLGLKPGTPEGENAVESMMAIGPDSAPSPEEFVKLVLEKIRKYHVEDRVILQSFDYRTLIAMKKIAPEIQLSALSTDPNRSFVDIAKEAGAQIISPVYVSVTPEKVAAAHKAGLIVVPWTANKPADWDKLIAAGVDAIISDDPASLIAYLSKNGAR